MYEIVLPSTIQLLKVLPVMLQVVTGKISQNHLKNLTYQPAVKE
jgi:hypothetical protein